MYRSQKGLWLLVAALGLLVFGMLLNVPFVIGTLTALVGVGGLKYVFLVLVFGTLFLVFYIEWRRTR